MLTENFEPYGVTNFNIELKVSMDPNYRPIIPSSLANSTDPCIQQYIELMQQCWQHDPAQRPSFEAVESKLDHIYNLFYQ